MNIILEFLGKIYQKIIYIKRVWNLPVKEPSYCLPISYTTAIRLLKNENKKEIWYKRYPFSDYMSSIKVLISKLELNFSNLQYKYIYSSWLSIRDLKNREAIKFSEEDFDMVSEIQSDNFFSSENSTVITPYLITLEWKTLLSTYEGIEKLLFMFEETERESYPTEIREYLLDKIFLQYPEKLYSLFDSIYSSQFSYYIQNYYGKLLILLFEYTDYTTLLSYFDVLETIYSESSESEKVKKRLLEIIQRKNTLEIRKEQLQKKWTFTF